MSTATSRGTLAEAQRRVLWFGGVLWVCGWMEGSDTPPSSDGRAIPGRSSMCRCLCQNEKKNARSKNPFSARLVDRPRGWIRAVSLFARSPPLPPHSVTQHTMFAVQTTHVAVARPGARVGTRRSSHGRLSAVQVRAGHNEQSAVDRKNKGGAHDDVDGVHITSTNPTRRATLVGLASVAATLALELNTPLASAIGFTKELKKKDVSEDDYLQSQAFDFRGAPHDGVKFYDLQKGQGDVLEAGKTAVVHYTCRYRGLTAVSSREARTLGGNRTVAEPLEFKFGKLPSEYAKPLIRKTVVGIGAEVRIDPELRELYVVNTVFDGPAAKAGVKAQDTIVSIDGVGDLLNVPIAEIGSLLQGDAGTDVILEVRKKGTDAPPEKITLTREATAVVPKKRVADVEGGGGLFTGEGAPKPPPLVYVPEALKGMKVGGRRNIVVPADVGYADVGEGEIPPGATFKLEVELLELRG